MSKRETIHTKRLSETHIRELSVGYKKAEMSYYDYKTRPCGIYLHSTVSEHAEGSMWKTWRNGQPTDGWVLVQELQRYKPTALRTVEGLVRGNPDLVHELLEASAIGTLKAFLRGEITEAQARSEMQACIAQVAA
jgi:hypothetical protein